MKKTRLLSMVAILILAVMPFGCYHSISVRSRHHDRKPAPVVRPSHKPHHRMNPPYPPRPAFQPHPGNPHRPPQPARPPRPGKPEEPPHSDHPGNPPHPPAGRR